MWVVPKRKHEEKMREKDIVIKRKDTDIKFLEGQVRKYQDLLNESIEKTEDEKREKNLKDLNIKIKEDKIKELEDYIDDLQQTLEDEQEANNELLDIVEEYENKELSEHEKEIKRIEAIQSRTKSYKVKKKCESRILKYKEMKMKREA